WALQANFSISRTIKGLDDLDVAGFPGGPVPDSQNGVYMQSVVTGGADAEPDMFYINLPGRSGKFTVTAEGSGIYHGKLFNQEKHSVVYIATQSAWTVTDEQGIRYVFGMLEMALPLSGAGGTPVEAIADLTSGNWTLPAWHIE